jgi:membrane protein
MIFQSLKKSSKTMVQQVWISLQYFGQNGLANHAAAGAYGFLLSLMPALLIVAFLVSRIFVSSPEAITEMILQVGFLGNTFDIATTIESFLNTFNPGLSGVLSLISMLWTAIVFAFSLQRGLNSIFFNQSEANSPIKNYLIPFGLEFSVILFVFISALGSHVSRLLGFTSIEGPFKVLLALLPLIGLGLLAFGAYCIVPISAPKGKSALAGTCVCIVLYGFISACFDLFMNPARYHLIYGTLGDLILLLAKVYFFFMLFFIGAQFAFVVEFFDAILFTKMRHTRTEQRKKVFFIDALLFMSVPFQLQKYLHRYKRGDVIFLKGEGSHDIYYILSGEAGIYLDSAKTTEKDRIASIVKGNFFGEMGYVLSNRRSATAKADTDLTVLTLPPALFNDILKIDQNADHKVIETLSERLKHTNEQLSKE